MINQYVITGASGETTDFSVVILFFNNPFHSDVHHYAEVKYVTTTVSLQL